MKTYSKKMALVAFSGCLMLSAQGFAYPSQVEKVGAYNPDDALTALSWTCRKGGCGSKKSSNNSQYTDRENAYDSTVETSRGVDSRDVSGSVNYDVKNEKEFVTQLSDEGKRLYKILAPEGKQLALRLAKQYADKNQAVKEAAQQTQNRGAKKGY
ncbi:MAG: hypothetical protein K940chlam7_00224 [Chlamydiae bacterium]|nr:hypothetical protein [Chlamydiota bacterium]